MSKKENIFLLIHIIIIIIIFFSAVRQMFSHVAAGIKSMRNVIKWQLTKKIKIV